MLPLRLTQLHLAISSEQFLVNLRILDKQAQEKTAGKSTAERVAFWTQQKVDLGKLDGDRPI